MNYALTANDCDLLHNNTFSIFAKLTSHTHALILRNFQFRIAKKGGGKEIDGEKYTWDNQKTLRDEICPDISVKTFRNKVKDLIRWGLLKTKDGIHSHSSKRRTLFYALNQNVLNFIINNETLNLSLFFPKPFGSFFPNHSEVFSQTSIYIQKDQDIKDLTLRGDRQNSKIDSEEEERDKNIFFDQDLSISRESENTHQDPKPLNSSEKLKDLSFGEGSEDFKELTSQSLVLKEKQEFSAREINGLKILKDFAGIDIQIIPEREEEPNSAEEIEDVRSAIADCLSEEAEGSVLTTELSLLASEEPPITYDPEKVKPEHIFPLPDPRSRSAYRQVSPSQAERTARIEKINNKKPGAARSQDLKTSKELGQGLNFDPQPSTLTPKPILKQELEKLDPEVEKGLKQYGIPKDPDIVDLIKSHDVSQALGALIKIEQNGDSIICRKAYFKKILPTIAIEKRGMRLPEIGPEYRKQNAILDEERKSEAYSAKFKRMIAQARKTLSEANEKKSWRKNDQN